MIHKLMDIFGGGREARQKSQQRGTEQSDTQASESKIEDANSNKPIQISAEPTKDLKMQESESDSKSDGTSFSESLSNFLMSTAKSSEERDNCFGCKVTATVMFTSCVLFGHYSLMSGSKEAKQKLVHGLHKTPRATRPLKVIHVFLFGAWLAFMYSEWFAPRSKKEEPKDNS
ncbi:hypothetical protein ACF0H5_002541 [Mactra antiquata]